jgi:hypothetical protein
MSPLFFRLILSCSNARIQTFYPSHLQRPQKANIGKRKKQSGQMSAAAPTSVGIYHPLAIVVLLLLFLLFHVGLAAKEAFKRALFSHNRRLLAALELQCSDGRAPLDMNRAENLEEIGGC